jgi:hypothetical protein
MITKRDCLLLLTEMESQGIDTKEMIKVAMRSKDLDEDVLKFINDHRQIDASSFYEKIRKSYNSKRSTLYKNIVTCDEVNYEENVLTTLASLNLQILLFVQNVQDERLFLRSVRFEEINQALLNYSKTFDLVPCIQVLQVIKSDLKVFEYINNI